MQTFTVVDENDAKLIKAAIDAAQTTNELADKEFKERWEFGADKYFWRIARHVADGKCWLCEETAVTWIGKHLPELTLSEGDLEKVSRGFVDVAHIKTKAGGGFVLPNNVRVLCPTCHRIFDRLPEGRREDFLNSKYQSPQ